MTPALCGNFSGPLTDTTWKSAPCCHGNPVHPNPETARAYDKTIRDTILLAQRLGLRRINTFSGCPGSDPDAHYPNWVTCPWPEDFQEVLDHQWNQVLIPHWRERRPSPLSTALLKSLWKCIRASAFYHQSRSSACAAPWESRSAPI